MKPGNRVKEIKISIPEDVYSIIEDVAKKEGLGVSDYIIFIVTNYLTGIQQAAPADSTLERLKVKLERYLQDELNKRMVIVENLRRQIVELYDRLGSIEQRVSALEDLLRGVNSRRPEKAVEVPQRKTAIERLREEKILFESKLPPRIQRDRLFAYLERSGAVILKLTRERVAVDRDFWNLFKHKLLNEVNSSKEEDVLTILGSAGYELWKALHSDNLLIFDPKTRKWKFVEGSAP